MGHHGTDLHPHLHATGLLSRTITGGLQGRGQRDQYHLSHDELLRADHCLLPEVSEECRLWYNHGQYAAILHRLFHWLGAVADCMDTLQSSVRTGSVTLLQPGLER